GQFSYPPDGPCIRFQAGWGTVIKVAQSPNEDDSIDLSAYPTLILPSGVTLRGDRRGTLVGPQINATLQKEKDGAAYISQAIAGPECEWCMIQVHGDYVRITGLRLTGQSRALDPVVEATNAIEVDYPRASLNNFATATEYIAMIDHNDISGWESAAIRVDGGHAEAKTCSGVVNDQRTQDNVRIERNFLHHNMRWSGGYGSVMEGGRALILGNIFLMNRHAIASTGEAHSQYRAWYNIVLSNVPDYDISQGGKQQDFDMHGAGSGGYGGIAGNRVEIAGNAFLGADHFNFELRGHPCFVSDFDDNVTRRAQSDHSINLHNTGDPSIDFFIVGPNEAFSPVSEFPYVSASVFPIVVPTGSYHEQAVIAYHNQYADSSPAFSNPTADLRVGDFDGDGVQDLFLATGTAWYYSPAGVAEWRLLSARPQRTTDLLFGDFDGDGRTDVVTLSGGHLMVSWGGVSDWETINLDAAGIQISDLQAGNFTGDQRDDIFWADGKSWRVSDHGAAAFVQSQTSSLRVSDLRFGNFTRSGKMDVFGIIAGKWQVSYSATSSWTALPVSLTTTVNGLVVADFDGDGLADIATSDGNDWRLSSNGAGGWSHRSVQTSAKCDVQDRALTSALAVGRFSGVQAVDVLLWNQRDLCRVAAGSTEAQRWSRQDMK
ncbi:MAG TPA: VCBS repeat-containing protein, partial [Kofleriaceae bacterium]|nr:VCBS repeat-containing protein [Kofleriaceae bacterium]